MKEDKEYEHNTTKDLEHWLAIFVCVVRHLVESWRSERVVIAVIQPIIYIWVMKHFTAKFDLL